MITLYLWNNKKDAVKKLKLNTSPALDGFTPEFYKKNFLDSQEMHLRDLFAACKEKNQTPDSWAEVSIYILPKEGKDMTLPQSYRPIAILNVDYKIFSTVLATRLNKILEYYIH